ncbi:hypothetical protein ACPPVW_14220 [Leifsonia sp. McL0607]|uniref:hypothetical protein n=1 Tax=Leifsonia sp. McL0607 TaxID=3415672 RepID=UPI003CEB1FE9
MEQRARGVLETNELFTQPWLTGLVPTSTQRHTITYRRDLLRNVELNAWKITCVDEQPGLCGGEFTSMIDGAASLTDPVLLDALSAGAIIMVGTSASLEARIFSKSQLESLQSLIRHRQQHIEKLADYKANPDAHDNKGVLKAAGDDAARRNSIINGRVRHLNNEIRAAEKNIADLYEAARLRSPASPRERGAGGLGGGRIGGAP